MYTGVVIAALLAVVIALAVVLGVERAEKVDRADKVDGASEDVCLTDGCIQLSAQITASLNQSVDPCENFYQFSCGNWERTNIIDPGISYTVKNEWSF